MRKENQKCYPPALRQEISIATEEQVLDDSYDQVPILTLFGV